MVEMNNKEETANEFPLYGGGDEQGECACAQVCLGPTQHQREMCGAGVLGLTHFPKTPQTHVFMAGLFHTHFTGDEDGMGPVAYPQRPGETECQYYMKTGTCK